MDNEDFSKEIYPDSEPRQAKGGVFAPADIKLIKDAVTQYAQNSNDDQTVKQVVNLLHRLNRIAS